MFSQVSIAIENCSIFLRTNLYTFLGYAWAKLMKTKKASETVEKFKEILSTVDVYPIQCLADKG